MCDVLDGLAAAVSTVKAGVNVMVNAIASAYQFITNLVLGVILDLVALTLNSILYTVGTIISVMSSGINVDISNKLSITINGRTEDFSVSTISKGLVFNINNDKLILDNIFSNINFKHEETLGVSESALVNAEAFMSGFFSFYLVSLLCLGKAPNADTITFFVASLLATVYMIFNLDIIGIPQEYQWPILLHIIGLCIFSIVGLLIGMEEGSGVLVNVIYKFLTMPAKFNIAIFLAGIFGICISFFNQQALNEPLENTMSEFFISKGSIATCAAIASVVGGFSSKLVTGIGIVGLLILLIVTSCVMAMNS